MICSLWPGLLWDLKKSKLGNEYNEIPSHILVSKHPLVPEIKYRGKPSNFTTSDHPHAGARDANGLWNYVPDVTFLRRKILYHLNGSDPSLYFPLESEIFEQVCQVAPGLGVEGPDGYKVLRLHSTQWAESSPRSYLKERDR
jgi:hypothetical protein